MDRKTKGIIGILVGLIILLLIVLGIVIFGLGKSDNLATNKQQELVREENVTTEEISVEDNNELVNMEDAIVEKDLVKLLPILDQFSIDGRHITEWNVDSLIAKYGLYMTNGKYQNEKESDSEYEEARIEGDKKTFIWNKVSRKSGVKYSYEFHENYDDLSNCTYYTFVTLTNNYNGDNPWAKDGVTEFAIDNEIVDAKSFLMFLGVSDTVADAIVSDGQKHLFVTDCPGDYMIPAIISCDWNGVKVKADELVIIYHQDIGRLELIYSDTAFWEWGREIR